jgi:uncharacterized coiled-coil protein SlyX
MEERIKQLEEKVENLEKRLFLLYKGLTEINLSLRGQKLYVEGYEADMQKLREEVQSTTDLRNFVPDPHDARR